MIINKYHKIKIATQYARRPYVEDAVGLHMSMVVNWVLDAGVEQSSRCIRNELYQSQVVNIPIV